MSNSTRTIASIASAAPSAASMPNPQSSGNRLSARASTQQPLTDQVTSQESADSKTLEGKVLTGKGDTHTISYTAERVIGTGSFGVVFQASIVGTGESVAIKKVLQDKRFKNRELQIMKMLDHGNIVSLKHFFYSNGDRPDEVYLNLVMDYIPETVYRVSRHYSKSRQTIPLIFIKLYMYQLFRSLAYLHSIGVCHRDIKPQNLLLDPQSGVLKLCDFGSAKLLIRGEPNVSYICSRYYRAPELLFGSTNYTTSIELLIGQPLFTADNGIDQLVEIIKVLGTPTREEITTMNPVYVDYKLPHLKPHPWQKIFRPRTPPEVVDFISKVLLYVPDQRLRPTEALAHPFFDELRDANLKLPTGRLPPPLFNFAPIEMRGTAPETIKRCVPDHALSLLGMTFTQFLSACTTAYSTASGQ